MNINHAVFREYDIRGVVGRDLSEEFAYALGRAFAERALELQCKTIAVGSDCRLSSPTFCSCLAQGLLEGGIHVALTGVGPTPQLYFSVIHNQYGGGIQVTGSHNPANHNGFKMCFGAHTLASEEIQDLKERVLRLTSAGTIFPATLSPGRLIERPAEIEYCQYIIENCRPYMGKRPLKVVVDAGNGVGGSAGPAVLRGLGVEVIELFCDFDGRFPNHHPDPTVADNLVTLRERVLSEKADFGIAFDGDADRIGIVDNTGEIIYGDMFVLICARDILRQQPGATIVGDVKCSQNLFDGVRKAGGVPVMWKTGHSLIKAKLKELDGALAGELSGHVMFKHRYFGFDDAIYAAARFAELVSQSDRPVSTFLADVPKVVSTPEIQVECPEDLKFKVANEAKKSFGEYRIDTTDGVRIMFDRGWGLVRASNTQGNLIMRFEAADIKALETYEALVRQRVVAITEKLILERK